MRTGLHSKVRCQIMRIAVCGVSPAETEQLCGMIEGYCCDRGMGAELCPAPCLEVLWERFSPGVWPCVVLGQEDTAGFLAARRLRERDRFCRILLISDTDRFALQSIRLHVTDFILRPVTAPRLSRGLDLLFRQR